MTVTGVLESDAIYLSVLLLVGKPKATPSEIAIALKDPRVYPDLTAPQIVTTLKDNQVFPTLTASQMTQALTDAGYPASEIQQAVAQLPQPRQYRQLGPVGVQDQLFDDTTAARSLGQPLSKIILHSGNIIDAITTFYGDQQQAFPTHGGAGGSETDVVFDRGDELTEVSGFYGEWFGMNYILQLTLATRNGKAYGPYGDMSLASTPTEFHLLANANEQVLAFFGATALGDNGNALYLSSIGITIQTNDGYDLKPATEQALAFDYDGSSLLDHLVLYQPGTGVIFILKNSGGQFAPVFTSGTGIGGYDLKSAADQVFAFDYTSSGQLDHLVLYRPGTSLVVILKHSAGQFAPVFTSETGIGGYDLKSPGDRAFAFDYEGSGKLDYLVFYRPGTGAIFIIKNNAGQFSSVYAQGQPGSGIGGYDLKSTTDRVFAFDYDGSSRSDHLMMYQPGTGMIFIVKNSGGQFTPAYQMQ